jgi:hypothetical protein
VVVFEENGTEFKVRKVFVFFVGIDHHVARVLIIKVLE